MPPGYFAPSHFPMLIQLCRHNVAANCIGALLTVQYKLKKLDLTQLATLLGLQCAESNSINRLMRSLRLTHQALIRADNVKPRPLDMLDTPWIRHDERKLKAKP